jgi:hypothetical protein
MTVAPERRHNSAHLCLSVTTVESVDLFNDTYNNMTIDHVAESLRYTSAVVVGGAGVKFHSCSVCTVNLIPPFDNAT